MIRDNILFTDENPSQFQMIADIDGDIDSLLNQSVDGEMPILATRNMVLHPGVLVPIMVTRESTFALVNHLKRFPDTPFAVICQKDSNVDDPQDGDLYEYGVIGKFIKTFEVPGMGANMTVVVQGLSRCQLKSITSTTPFLCGNVEVANEDIPTPIDIEYQSALANLRKQASEFVVKNDEVPGEIQYAISNMMNDTLFVNFLCTNMPFPIEDKARMIACDSMMERVLELLGVLNREQQFVDIRLDIRRQTQQTIDDEQKEYFLRHQLHTIRKELGTENQSPERQKLLEKAAKIKWSKEIQTSFNDELMKLDQLNPQSPEYNVQLSYLQQIVDLPWEHYTEDDLDLMRAEKVLNKDHYGMENVKDRILEYISVLKMRGDLKSPIICLYGPPGVGKTSLGKSIAHALRREYVRMSLGGLHDETEIRGHRRTYVGAMAGRIIKNIQKAKSSNPVFVLDEIDKIAQNTIQGDPSSALLEVLDPEQNSTFHDNYLDLDYDLSKVLFIATANDISNIPGPLRDRMEMIEVSGYITEEKIEIAKRHLIPKAKDNNGLASERKLSFKKNAIEFIIERYTRESGVRQLEKQINKVLRKVAYKTALSGMLSFEKITKENVEELLGNPPFYRDIYQGNEYAGVVTGLAWTSVGGEILFIETSLSKGKNGKLTLTGNLGDVMKESAVIALEYVKAHASVLDINPQIFDNWNIHIHVPEGATPKDGPSAGITIATSIASALTQRKVRKNVAMTGEITLRGKVLPVGGIKEKILAAKRAGITDIMLCEANEKDIKEIPDVYLKGVTFHYVENVQDVWRFALTDEKVKDAIQLTVNS